METNERILSTIGNKKCTYGCIYCFVDNENYSGLERIDNVNAENIFNLKSKKLKIIQPAADVELTLVPDYIGLLGKLIPYKKHISFSTKTRAKNLDISGLIKINEELMKSDYFLQVAVSILKLNEWRELELKTPSPFERIETLKILFDAGLKTSVAFRPLLPFINKSEIEEIVELTHRYTYAYLTGPTYLTPALKKYMAEKEYNYDCKQKAVSWIPNKPSMDFIKSEVLEKHLKISANKYNLPVYSNNVDLVLSLAKNEKKTIL